MNLPRVGYTRLDNDSPFCHFCMTPVHETKWLANTKTARPSLAYPSLPNFYLQEGSDYHFEELQSYNIILNVTSKQMKQSTCYPKQVGDIAR